MARSRDSSSARSRAARFTRRARARRAAELSSVATTRQHIVIRLARGDSRGRLGHSAAATRRQASRCSSCAGKAARASWRRRTSSRAARRRRRGRAYRRGARAVRRGRRVARREAGAPDAETLESPSQAMLRKRILDGANAAATLAAAGLAWSIDVSCRGRTGSRRRSSRSGSRRGSSSPSCRPGRSRSSTRSRPSIRCGSRPSDALARAAELQLPPPQIRTFWELAQYKSIERGARGRARARARSRTRSCRGSCTGTQRRRACCCRGIPNTLTAGTGESTPLTYRPAWATGPSRFMLRGQSVEARRRTWFDERGLSRQRAASVTSRSTRARCTTGACRSAVGRHACARCTRSGFTIVETYVPWRIHEPEAGDARLERRARSRAIPRRGARRGARPSCCARARTSTPS